jgi:Fe-S cluster biogenesis protein NfuA
MEDSITKLVSEKVNPVLMKHNGFSELACLEVDGNNLRVILTFYGSCTSCALSKTFTLRMIEEILQEHLPSYNIKVENAEYAD